MRKKQCCQNSKNIRISLYVSIKKTSLISKKTQCPHFHENYKSEPTVLKSTITKSYHNSPHIVMGYTFDFCEILKNQEMISVNFNTKFEI